MADFKAPLGEEEKNPWLAMASDAYQISTSYIDNNYRKVWENNFRHFNSKHKIGSKYLTSFYKYRSKIFRPKTRAAERAAEAAATAAFFANQDALSITATNPMDDRERASAEVLQELVQYRLDKDIRWFLTLIAAFQSAWVYGVVISKQIWEYESVTETDYKPLIGEDGKPVFLGGEPVIEEVAVEKPLKDRPRVILRPIENIRLHPSSDWSDPIGTSPFLVDMIPMFVMDIKRRMTEDDRKHGKPKWKKLDDGQIQAAIKHSWDTTRLTREENREDRFDQQMTKPLRMYDIAWVHENFMRLNGKDYVYHTLGTSYMLSDPKPVDQVYPHCRPWERPYVMGGCVIEPHKLYWSGVGELAASTQSELNENASQRSDNVKLVLNKRYLVKRGRQVDIRSLLRNAAGSVTYVDEIGGREGPDVFPMEFHDVTSSCYMEQDRLNADFDELVGAFSPSSIQTNRKLGETVGGMAMMRGSANQLIEHVLRTFAETWVEPVLIQLVRMEQTYETDQRVLAIAMNKAGLFQKYGINQVTDWLLDQELTVKVNVGMGATDPVMKVQTFMLGVKTIMEIFRNAPPGSLDVREVAKEVFGRLGFKDGDRFLVGQEGQESDPQKIQMAQMLQQMQMIVAALQGKLKDKASEHALKMEIQRMKEAGQDRRKAAELYTELAGKQFDLLNPVAGEHPPAGVTRGVA